MGDKSDEEIEKEAQEKQREANPEKVKKGKLSRAAGNRFELKVRADLESKKWIVDKWTNNVEFIYDIEKEFPKNICSGKLVKAKAKWTGPGRPMMMGAGFPDFIAFRISDSIGPHNYCEVIGVESKMDGKLDKEEKEKCKWLLDNNIFSKILIAKKGEKRGEINYVDFEEKYGKV